MVSLVAPGLLGTAAQFRAAHGAAPLTTPGKEPRNAAALRKQTAEVMIRHRRSEVSVLLPQRLAETVRVEPSGAERQWYADLTARVRAEGRTTTSAQRLALRSVAKLAGSSPAAAAPTLAKIGWDDLARRGSLLTAPAKVAVLLDRLRPVHPGGAEGPGVHRVPADPGAADRSGPGSLRSITAACRARRRSGRLPLSATRPRYCCPPSPPGRGAISSSAT